MRQIKFRVWNAKKKKWIHPPGHEVNLFGETILLGGFMNGVSVEGLNDCHALQFTGLLDKNKKEIYEGDIVKGSGDTSASQGAIVVIEYEPMRFVLRAPGKKWCRDLFLETLEVIGNIYDNPELCK